MILAFALSATLAGGTSCESLKTVSLPNTTITAAEMVAAGPYTAPAFGGGPPPAGGPGGRGGPAPADAAPAGRGRGPAATPLMLPAYCRVNAILRPSADSEIEMEVWMPASADGFGGQASGWNGKFQFVGGGGWAGNISFPAMASALQEGYATASTDTGHKGGNALFAIGHPEKVVDFAYRAVHESTVTSKALIAKFYDRAARLSYWNGCSTGGRQGLMEAQKYPEDFDAIVAGAPANFQTHLHAWDLSVSVPVLKDPAAAVPAAKLNALRQAAMAACDAKDGVTDGLINDPRACRFDPSVLLCKGADAENCLTPPQLESVKRMYAAAKTKSGETVFPGKEPGSETGWGGVLAGRQAPGVSIGSFQVAYNDANWDAKTFDLDRDLKIVDEKVGTHHQRRQPGPVGVQGARREAPALSRLGRHRDLARQRDQLLRERPQENGQAGQLRTAVHGAGDAALRQRSWSESGQLHGRHRALARVERGARHADRLPRDQQPRRHDAAAVPVPAGRDLQGRRQHERRG